MVKSEKEKAPAAAEMEAQKIDAEPSAAQAAEPEQAAASPEATTPEVPKHVIDAVIRKRVYAAMGVGLAPIPLFDLAAISAIQLEMVRALTKRYGVSFRPEVVKSIISSLVGGVLPVAAAPVAASLVKFIPFIGWTTAGVSMSLMGGAVTYALGQVFVMHFESGGVLLDFDVDKLRGAFQAKLKEGKTVASQMKEEQPASA